MPQVSFPFLFKLKRFKPASCTHFRRSMSYFSRKLTRHIPPSYYFILLFFLLIICFQILLSTSLPKLVPINKFYRTSNHNSVLCNSKLQKEPKLGELGEMMVSMLPYDLPFTLFVPSISAFEKVLKLNGNESLTTMNMNNTYAIVSRVLGFSAVPKQLPSGALSAKKETVVDSVSGFKLYAWKDSNGMVVVNGVKSVCVNLKIGEVFVHVMNGVLMDPEFEQSFIPDYEDR